MQDNKQPFETELCEQLNAEFEEAGITVSEALIARTLLACQKDMEGKESAGEDTASMEGNKPSGDGQELLEGKTTSGEQIHPQKQNTQSGRRKWIRTLAYSLGSAAAMLVLLVLGSQALSGGIKNTAEQSKGSLMDRFMMSGADSAAGESFSKDIAGLTDDSGYSEPSCNNALPTKAAEVSADVDYISKGDEGAAAGMEGTSENKAAESNDMTDAEINILESESDTTPPNCIPEPEAPMEQTKLMAFGSWLTNCIQEDAAAEETGATEAVQLMNTVRQEIEQEEMLEEAGNYFLAEVTGEVQTVTIDLTSLNRLLQPQYKENTGEMDSRKAELADTEVEYRFLITTEAEDTVNYYRISNTGAVEYTVYSPEGEKKLTVIYQSEEANLLQEIELWLKNYELVIE